MPAPTELLSYIDVHTAFIARLAEAVEIPSISGDPVFRPSVLQMPEWLDTQLQAVASPQARRAPHARLGRAGAPAPQRHPRPHRRGPREEDRPLYTASKSSPPRWAAGGTCGDGDCVEC
ncbi:hypothetical protein B0H17DRAFT_673568 [Mycena rosella]|uniref:Uncharacterized protein n=1 Tax=Mycena rosella TaxID=1033263 RepID=A0AAD7GCH4_MYCRO|nr:hypothetical protein B0H17DRAFT_673568 [Mycena rosella]